VQIPETEIIVTKDGMELLRKTVRPGEYVLGRDAECEVQVEAEQVSPRHAQLTVNFDHALIEDLGSESGTFVNGKAVTEATRLWPNQKIQVGAATIELRRLKTDSSPDHTLAPQTAALRTMLPEEFLRDKKYAIGGVVAQGGMGAILDAREATTERTVAMKVMLDGSSPEDLTRFVSEAKVTAQLEHPNIVPVHELGVDENDQVFYTMKFVRGVTLKKVLEEMAAGTKETIAKYPLGTLLTIFQKVCDAVAFAHSKGVIHRDLKPENVMIGDFGEVLLMDWGLAKVLGVGAPAYGIDGAMPSSALPTSDGDHRRVQEPSSLSSSATMAGSIMGTPQYMAPEQARGEVETMDARADIYALGAILYHLLALRPSVTGGDAMAIVEKVAAGEVETLGNGGGRSPDSLAAVVRTAMAFEKEKRYASVAALQADITAYQNGFATSAEKAGLVKQLTLLIKRHKGAFATAAAAWAIITALGVWFVINLRASERATARQAKIAKAEAARATQAEGEAVARGEAARRSLAKSSLNLAEAAQREGNGPGMQAALAEVPDDLRDSTWNYLFEQSDTSIARVRTETNEIDRAVPHPRLPGVFAVCDRNGNITLLEVRTGQRLLQFTPEKKFIHPVIEFSPDGERIAVGASDDSKLIRIAIHSSKDGKELVAWDAPKSAQLEFSTDGKLLLETEYGAKRIHVWDTADGTAAWSYPSAEANGVYGVFTADGQQAVTWGNGEGFRLVNAHDGSLVRALFKTNVAMAKLLQHPDGSIIAGGDHGLVLRFDPRDGRVLMEFHPGDWRVDHFALTPDGARLVTARKLPDGRQDIRLWDVKTGQQVQALLGGGSDVRGISVHPLTGEAVVAGPNARAWSLTGTPPQWIVNTGSERVSFFGSDEIFFARISSSYGFAVARLQSGNPAVLLKSPSGGYSKSSVSADSHIAALGGNAGGKSDTVILLRNPGPAVEPFASFPLRKGVNFLWLSPAGDRLLAVEYGLTVVELLNATTGQPSVKLERRKAMKKFTNASWLSDQRVVGLVIANEERGSPGSEEWIVLWDTASGKILQTATNRTTMDALAVAPNGRRFAEAGADRFVRIRDAATLAEQQEFRAHDGPITALAWHPTKPIVATASADLSVKLWNLETGRRLEEFRGLTSPPTGLAFSPSGQRLACSGPDATRVWMPKSLSDQPATPQENGGWQDLLATLTPEKVAEVGHGWHMESGALFSPAVRYAIMPLPGTFSGASYQVRVKLRQLAAKDVFHIVLPVGDRMVGFDLDGFAGKFTGLTLVNYKAGKDLPGIVEGKQVKDSEQHDLEVTVHLYETSAKITTTLDGQPLYEWAGPTAALSHSSLWATAPPGGLSLGTYTADWAVYEVQAKRLEK
jgi:serine/threonine protein kinase/WD40 repeat protein